jgi:membrane protease YdiL (CAAX protease family)
MSTITLTRQVLEDGMLDRTSRARRGLLLFFAILLPLSLLFEAATFMTHNLTWVLALMGVPAFSSMIARLVRHEGFADVSFRLGGGRGLKAFVFALLLPIVIGLIAYGTAWSTGLAHFVVAPHAYGAALLVNLPAPISVKFALELLLAATLGSSIGTLSPLFVAGEEIGWRGYMLTRLVDARIPHPVLVSGLIWGLWHLPLILAGSYATGASADSPLVSALVFLFSATSFAFIIARLRFATGSVWPAIALHTSWNMVIHEVFDRSTTGSQALLWTGESGMLVAITVLVVAIILSQGHWTMIRQLPKRGEPVEQEAIHP